MSTQDLRTSGSIIPVLNPLYETLAPLTDPLVRVVAGLFLVPHGAQKLFGLFGGYGLEATEQFFQAKLGLPAGVATFAGLIEFFGGIALAFGLLTRPAAALATGLLLVAALQVHLGKGFFWTSGGYEYPLLWAVVTLAYAVKGGGRYSIDRLIGKEI